MQTNLTSRINLYINFCYKFGLINKSKAGGKRKHKLKSQRDNNNYNNKALVPKLWCRLWILNKLIRTGHKT